MRYIADTDGYVKEVSFGADISCDGQSCTEYTGDVPEDYASLEAWYLGESEKLYRWKIVDGNLTLDSSAAATCDVRSKANGLAASARGQDSTLAMAAGAITPVPLNDWIARTDEAFGFSDDGGIICPCDGVVLISGAVYVPLGADTATGGCYLKKGATADTATELASQYITGIIGGVSAGPMVVSVTAGDVLYLCARRSTAGNCLPNNAATHLNIVYVNYELMEV